MPISVHALVQVRNRFLERQAFDGQRARLLPERNRRRGLPRRRQVMRQQLRFGGGGLREVCCEHPRDRGVQLLSAALQQRVVGGILHQRVLEGVGGLGRGATAERESGVGQLLECVVEVGLGCGQPPRPGVRS